MTWAPGLGGTKKGVDGGGVTSQAGTGDFDGVAASDNRVGAGIGVSGAVLGW